MDSHIREYEELDRTYRPYLDPAYADAYELLSHAVTSQQALPGEQVLFMRARAVLGPTPPRRPLGLYDTFPIEGPQPQGSALAQEVEVDPACNWDPMIRLKDMDTAAIDISVLFPSQADGFCVLRDVGFESALHRAYHRFVSQYCAPGGGRLRWLAVGTMRDPQATVEEVTSWAKRDDNLAGIFISRACPDGRLLDNPDLHPIYACAQELELPIFIHGGTLRPPLTPGAHSLDNSAFLINAVYHPWGGMTAMGALIGGGVFDLFPRLRVGLFESGGGWMPWLVARLDDAYSPGSRMTPNLKRRPSEVVAEGRLVCSFDPDEEFMGYCVEKLGEDVWVMGTDYPHQGSSFPEGVPQIVERTDLTESAKTKIVGGNALRICPRLASWAAPTVA
jgi:predicted TIM-barrel fold metal-dependent hydrolase